MLVGGVLGGLAFRDAGARGHQKGGYVRKASATLAHIAARRRDQMRKLMKGVLEVRPFNALPSHDGNGSGYLHRRVDQGRAAGGARSPHSVRDESRRCA